MSRAESTVSEFSAVTLESSNSVGNNSCSLLQSCVYVKDYLGLDVYKDNNHEAVSSYHVKVSSKTLRQSYVIPGGRDRNDGSPFIADVFARLAELLEEAKRGNCKPPRSDFTCFAFLQYEKVFLDVDCALCKHGCNPNGLRHYSSTRLLNVILSTVARTFGEALREGVYLTNGGASCGYHIFFNTLAYSREDCGAAKEMLFDELEFALRQANLNNVVIDRNCTQMPLPTSVHSNSAYHSRPYRMEHVRNDDNNGNKDRQWKRVAMRWNEMDAELLKCFSCISFSQMYTWKVVSAKTIPSRTTTANAVSIATPPSMTKRKATESPGSAAGATSPKRGRETTAGGDEKLVGVVSGPDVEIKTGAEERDRSETMSDPTEDDVSLMTDQTLGGGSFVVPKASVDNKRDDTDHIASADECDRNSSDSTEDNVFAVMTATQSVATDVIGDDGADRGATASGFDSHQATDFTEDNVSVVTANTSGGESFVVPIPGLGKPFVDVDGETDYVATAKNSYWNLSNSAEDNVSVMTAITSCDESFVVPKTKTAYTKGPDTGNILTAARTAATESGTETNESPRCDGDETVSLLSTNTDDAASFVLPRESAYHGLGETSAAGKSRRSFAKNRTAAADINKKYKNTNVRDGDEDEDDRSSEFGDKVYKDSLLRTEEIDAAASRARLTILDSGRRSRTTTPPRIYFLPGTSWEETRKYKLLVQLDNVKRAVYSGDRFKKSEWADIKVSYYDQHLNNPIILKIFDFVFKEDRVKTLFEEFDLNRIYESIARLMAPFEVKRRECNDLEETAVEQAEKEARPYKSLLVGALIRVCTNLFIMITAVISDLRKMQLLKKHKNNRLLNCTVLNERQKNRYLATVTAADDDDNDDNDDDNGSSGSGDNIDEKGEDEDEYGPDCSASMSGFRERGKTEKGYRNENRASDKQETLYAMLASLIAYEEYNLSDHSLYVLLYYYHYFPSDAITKIMNEIQHGGLMVTAMIRYFLVYDHQKKPLTLLEIFNGFNDVSISLWGPERYEMIKRKSKKKDTGLAVKNNGNGRRNENAKRNRRNSTLSRTRDAGGNENNNNYDYNDNDDELSNGSGECSNDAAAATAAAASVTEDELNRLLCGRKRCRKMLSQRTRTPDGEGAEEYVRYEFRDYHMWQAVINYYLRPVAMHDEKLVFANNGYDTLEEDAIDSCVAHVVMKDKTTKADVSTAFRDARTTWRMPHGSQLLYESDITSEVVGCGFHINVALKIYEMFCGGCLTRMKRVYANYLSDNTRFDVSVYDVVAECRTAAVNLTSAVDRSYMNLLLCQPVVPAVFEDIETRQLFMSDAEMKRGSFCCLYTMDYIRVLNLFERANCQSKQELETCDYVERFLDDMYVGEIAADGPPNPAAATKTRLIYTFYSLFIYEVIFNMRHAYATRENCFVSIERLCKELEVRELFVLFFGESSMTRYEGLSEETERRINGTADDLCAKKVSSSLVSPSSDYTGQSEHGRFDVRPTLAADIPDKVSRMKALFGQFGFDVMQDDYTSTTLKEKENSLDTSCTSSSSAAAAAAAVEAAVNFENEIGDKSRESGATENGDRDWSDERKFERLFYTDDDWLENTYRRVSDKDMTGRNVRNVPTLSAGLNRGGTRVSGRFYSAERLFFVDTVRTVMRLQLKRHIDHDRLGKLYDAFLFASPSSSSSVLDKTLNAMKSLPMRLKLLAFVLTTHTVKLKTTRLAADFVDSTYREPDGLFADERRVYEGEVNKAASENNTAAAAAAAAAVNGEPPEKVWMKRTESVLNDRRSLLLHARWTAEKRFKNNFFVGLDPVQVYNTLYEFMKCNRDEYPAFRSYNENKNTRTTTRNLCTAMMFLLVMSAYDQEELELYLKMFLAVEWPGQWAKTIFVWKSNSNAGKSYFFDSIIKQACATSTCINDPKGGKENAPEKAEYVRNFVLFANEFSQANSNELKKIVSESTFKFRMNYGNVMNEIYATGKIMFNCNTLPPTSDEAAINRLTLFSMPFWFSNRQSISDALLNWTRGHSVSDRDHWELAYRYELPSLFTDKEKEFLKTHENTKNEADLFDGFVALRPNMFTVSGGGGGNVDFSKAKASLFLVQNKISRLYVSCAPPTEQIVHGLVNITNHFSWLRFFNRLDAPVDFTSLPATSEAVRSEWLSLTLPYQEWKQATGARHDPACRTPVGTINRSLQAFALKKNVNYFGIRQFFETDFASSREAIEDVYYVRFDTKVFSE